MMEEDEAYFDYQAVTEEKDDLNFNELKPCPHCKKPIPTDAILCLYCGESTYQAKNKNLWFIALVIGVIVAFLLLVLLI